jgi:flagellar P-ring protein precursor FlgI
MDRSPSIVFQTSRMAAIRHFRQLLGVIALIFGMCLVDAANAASRLKDITDFEGIRENQLVGYGLVVGLNGSGDRLSNSPFTQQSLIGMLERLGINTRGISLNTANIAAVMVTATLPPFARQGTRIDVTVSALGDAKSLLGGTLLVTPLLGADGEVYVVAQGQLAVGGFSAEGSSGTTVTKGVPTSGRIPNGAIVEREVDFELGHLGNLNISLRNPDLTTAARIAQAINVRVGEMSAEAIDPGTVRLKVPQRFRENVATLLTDIEQLKIEPDTPARVVIDEQSGIIVMGENVRINRVAIAQGNLTIRITETPQVSQPGAFAPEGAQTTTVQRSDVKIDEGEDKRMAIIEAGVSLHELVEGLNALGIGPRDMITILQTIKVSGALQAEIEIL